MPSDLQPEIFFKPSNQSAPARPEQNLLQAAQAAGVGLEAPCGGKGLCGKCRVRPEGEATDPTPGEKALLGTRLADGLRLACQCAMPAGGQVHVPPESRRGEAVILTSGRSEGLELDPAITSHELSLAVPSLEAPEAARERLFAALAQARGQEPGQGFDLPMGLLRALPGLLASGGGRLSAALRHGREVVDLRPAGASPALGLAVDLGTTTMVAYLCDLSDGQLLAVSAAMNPQAPWGADVISRISACQSDPQALGDMSRAVVESLNQLARDACAQAGAEAERILECVMVGNSAMHHIFLKLDPASLAQAPYAPLARRPVELKARELGLELAPEAWLHWLPLKAGFVGADIVAAALAVGADQIQEPTLLLDLGTNGEMVLAARGRMLACSTAAGPALEGGHIGQGMRGAPGAVERARLAKGGLPLELSVIEGLPPVGFCGSGLVSMLSCLLEAGALGESGSFDHERAGEHLRQGDRGPEYVAAPAEHTGHGQELVLSAADVAELQLAKAAIRAGAQVLMEQMGVDKLERVLLAGAFGNYLDPAEARRLGMFPEVAVEAIEGVGNAAGVGAVMALLSLRQRRRAMDLSEAMRYVELSGHPLFNDLFVDSMPFQNV
ncbi:MAG: ASKHA domain-containing protein [Desulfarculaceae bacterium]|nr:ASKHA domain-containing protein [Desulfarculaceae bacterium]MCF8073202.1 ASKHA domain-containing protein [Desulfarculaceae bacterium]MCF8100798.1 ASKHA domain-containing protein [Desulfarculaceae bacterium]MCF8118445.1 ASKHA domain-containing protein [Desulfarculaceae bacterium]